MNAKTLKSDSGDRWIRRLDSGGGEAATARILRPRIASWSGGGDHGGDRVAGSRERDRRKSLTEVALVLLVWAASLWVLFWITGCALTVEERCAQARAALSVAESLPKTPERDARIPVYRGLVAQNCTAARE